MNNQDLLKFIEEFNKPIQEIRDREERLIIDKIEKIKEILKIESTSTELMFVCGKNIYKSFLQISDVCEIVEDKLNLVEENSFIMIQDYKLKPLKNKDFNLTNARFIMSPFSSL